MFSNIIEIIVLVSTGFIAIDKICEILGKPLIFAKEKREERDQLMERLTNIENRLTDLEKLNVEQNEHMELLTNASLDMLRQNIIYLYDHHKAARQLTEREHAYLEDLYIDYTNENGNSYIKFLKEVMDRWEIIPDNDE